MAELKLKGLCKAYGSVEAVKNLDLEIGSGDFMVIVGPSGCGKTTTLRMIAGLEELTGGDIYLDGEKINEKPPKDRDMAMVFQDYALYPHMTVFDNMGFGLKMRKVDKKEVFKRVTETAELLNVSSLLKRRPHELSGGERQRVALGRAIVRRPKVFLFDEPLSNLDAALRTQMRGEISRLHGELGTTFIYVTHDQIEAMTMATKISVMDKGTLQQSDVPHALYYNPSNLFVAGFIGNPKMNIMQCILETRLGELYLYIGGNEIGLPGELKEKFFQKRMIGKRLYLGIRPECIFFDDKKFHLHADIYNTEHTGADVFYYLNAGQENSIVVRTSPGNMYDKKQTGIRFNWEDILFFDSDGLLICF